MGSLNSLCKSFNVPEKYCKSSMDHNYTEETWEENIHIWKPYLKLDITSLAFIMVKLFKTLFDITGLQARKSLSIASFAKKYVD